MILHAQQRGAGPPLVLLHGLFGVARNFATVQRHLAGSFRVLALDLRNHGASPHAPGMSYAQLAADVRETLAAAAALPSALLGHSMGGKVAMRLALDAPEAVSRLFVADIAPRAYPPSHGATAAALTALKLTPGLTRAAADAALAEAVPEAGVRAFLLQNLLPGAAPSWRIGLAEIAAGIDDILGWPEPPPAAHYDAPTLFLAGAASDYLRPEDRAPIRARFPAARFATLADAGHWLHADNPAGFMAALREFLAA